MIRFSAALVAVAIGVLIAGGVTSRLALVYLAIVVGAVALVCLAIGVLLAREEIFGNRQGLASAAADASPAISAGTADRGQSGSAAPAVPVSAGAASGPAAAGPAVASAGRAPAWPTAAAAVPTVPHRVLSPTVSTGQFAAGPAAEQQQSAVIPSAAPWERPTRAEPRPPAADGQPPPAGAGTAPQPDAAAEAGDADTVSAANEADAELSSPGWFDWPGRPAGLSTATAAPDEPATTTAAPDEPAVGGRQPDLSERSPSGLPSAVSGEAAASGTAEADPSVTPGNEVPAAQTVTSAPVTGKTAAAETVTAETVAPAMVTAGTAAAEPADKTEAETADTPAADTPAADTPAEGRTAGETAVQNPPAEDSPVDDTPEADTAGEGNDPVPETASVADDAPAPVDGLVAVIRGVPRYHQTECVLIRFMPDDDLERLTVPSAQAAGCTPCTACLPAE